MKCKHDVGPTRARENPVRSVGFAIVQPIRNNAAKTLRALAEPHWLMRRQLRKLSRSPETFRHAQSAQREHAVPELQRVTLPAHEYVRKPSPRVFGGSPRSIGHLFPARSRYR